MNQYQRKLCWALLSSLLLVGSTQAGIKRVVFQGSQRIADLSKDVPRGAFYQGPDTPNNLSPGCPTCKPGESSSPNWGAGVPNQIVTFLHPYTNKAITIPLTLPVGKPDVRIKRDRIVYHYGLLKKVIVHFKPNNVVEVVYID